MGRVLRLYLRRTAKGSGQVLDSFPLVRDENACSHGFEAHHILLDLAGQLGPRTHRPYGDPDQVSD